MDDLVIELRKTGKGCHIVDLFIACILYADDVCLLAPTRRSLQLLLDICSRYASTWCIRYNERKTKLMYFGNDYESFSCSPIVLNDVPLDFVPKWKYLGVILKSDKRFSCSAEKSRSAFYRSSNTILNVLNGPSNDVQMKLLYSICVPIIMYACDVVAYDYFMWLFNFLYCSCGGGGSRNSRSSGGSTGSSHHNQQPDLMISPCGNSCLCRHGGGGIGGGGSDGVGAGRVSGGGGSSSCGGGRINRSGEAAVIITANRTDFFTQ